MDKQRIIWGIVAIAGMCMPILGMLIGCIRYKKNGDAVRQKVKEDYKRAQEKGGIPSLYYKKEGQRVFKLTFGTPMLITFLLGLGLMGLAFFNL